MPNAKLKIVEKLLSELKMRRSNPRTHGKMQVRKIADSIQKFGFVTPILVDGDNVIIAGHGRLEAAKLLDLKSVPTLMVDHLTPAEIKAYVIADNKLASLAGWDKKLLALEIAEIAELDVDFDLTVTGFDIAELSLLTDTAASHATCVEPEVAEPDRSISAVTKLGDIWQCGLHVLVCGDALDPQSYQALLGDERADVVITDPPLQRRDRRACFRTWRKHPSRVCDGVRRNEPRRVSALSVIDVPPICPVQQGRIAAIYLHGLAIDR